MKAIGYVTLFLISMVLNAYAMFKLWHWFAVPIGAMSVNIYHAFGLALLVRFLTVQTNSGYHIAAAKHHGYTPDASITVANSILTPLVALAFGWFAHALAGSP